MSLQEIQLENNLSKNHIIVCGSRHCLAYALDTPSFFIWGEHIMEGDEREKIMISPIEINLKFSVSQVACGFDHSLILESGGFKVHGFGNN